MADAALCHDGDGDRLLDAADHGRVAHAGHAAGRADVGGDALECHDRAGAGGFGNARLFGRSDIHDNAAFQHLGELPVEGGAVARRLLLIEGCAASPSLLLAERRAADLRWFLVACHVCFRGGHFRILSGRFHSKCYGTKEYAQSDLYDIFSF